MTNKKDLTKYVWAFTLGDGALSSLKSYYLVDQRKVERLQYDRPKNSHYYLKQLSTHRDYVEYQASILEHITGTSITVNDSYTDNRGYVSKEQLHLKTKNHPFFTTMRNRVYYNGIKAVSVHDLKLLDWQCAALFYMDDGWLEVDTRTTKEDYVRVGIASHSYTHGDNILLRSAIAEKLGVHFDIARHKQKSGEYKFYLRAKKDQAKRFLEGVSPYILPSFEYKLVERLAPAKGDDIV